MTNAQGEIVGHFEGWESHELINDSPPRHDLWSKRHPKAFKILWLFSLTLNVVAWGAHLIQ